MFPPRRRRRENKTKEKKCEIRARLGTDFSIYAYRNNTKKETEDMNEFLFAEIEKTMDPFSSQRDGTATKKIIFFWFLYHF